MNPRISSLEAMTHPLSINPIKRRWEVMRLIGEAAAEADVDLSIIAEGLFLGRTALVQTLQAIELAEKTGSLDAVEKGHFSHISKLEESEN